MELMRLRSNKHRKKKKKAAKIKIDVCMPPSHSFARRVNIIFCFFVCLFVLYQLALARTKDFAKQGELLKPNAK